MLEFNPVLGIVVPVVAAIVAMLLVGWGREKRTRASREKERESYQLALNAALPNGTLEISTGGLSKKLRDGRIMLVLNGTFAARQGENILSLLYRSGLEAAVGSVLLIEGDSRSRAQFLATVPAIFASRIVAVDFPSLAGGFGNATPHQVESLIADWGPELLRATNSVAELHEQRQHDGPALILNFVGLGGGAITGTLTVEELRRRYRLASFYGFSALPVDDRLRTWAPYVFRKYRSVGVRGFVLADNLGDEVLNDFGMDGAVVGFTVAALYADAGVEANNAFTLLFARAPGGIVSFHTYAKTIPGEQLLPTHPSVPPRYYVFSKNLRSSITAALAEVNRSHNHALRGKGLDGQVPQTSQFDIVLAAVHDLKTIEDDIVLGQRLKKVEKRNRHLVFAPIATPIDPNLIRCPVAVVSLRAVQNPSAILAQLTRPAAGTSRGQTRPPRLSRRPGGQRNASTQKGAVS